MTVKWVQQDPLVMNGEPFCYGSRLTVRQLLELRANGYDLTRILTDHPELRRVGVAAAFTYASTHRERYADFFEPDGSLVGPGYSDAEAAGLPSQYRLPGRSSRRADPAIGATRPRKGPAQKTRAQPTPGGSWGRSQDARPDRIASFGVGARLFPR